MSNIELVEGFPNDLYALTNDHENLSSRPRRFNDTMFQRSTCIGFIHAWFSPPLYIRTVPYAKLISAW